MKIIEFYIFVGGKVSEYFLSESGVISLQLHIVATNMPCSSLLPHASVQISFSFGMSHELGTSGHATKLLLR